MATAAAAAAAATGGGKSLSLFLCFGGHFCALWRPLARLESARRMLPPNAYNRATFASLEIFSQPPSASRFASGGAKVSERACRRRRRRCCCCCCCWRHCRRQLHSASSSARKLTSAHYNGPPLEPSKAACASRSQRRARCHPSALSEPPERQPSRAEERRGEWSRAEGSRD